MALVIENGSLVAGATSYASVSEARAYAAARASTLPAEDSAVEAALIVAMDYIESFRDDFQGMKVDPLEQPLQWPRAGVRIDGAALPCTSIPKELKAAQCQLAIESAGGLDLMPTGDGRDKIREKLDVIETEWAPGSGGSDQPFLSKVRALMVPLFRSGEGRLKAIRG